MSITPKPEPTDTPLPPKPAPDAKAKQAALKAHSEYRRAQAWAIARWPLEKRIVHQRARVHLPRTYLARNGSDVRVVYPGTDLNQFVHRHYCEEVESARGDKSAMKEEGQEVKGKDGKRLMEGCPNYVAAEGILARR